MQQFWKSHQEQHHQEPDVAAETRVLAIKRVANRLGAVVFLQFRAGGEMAWWRRLGNAGLSTAYPSRKSVCLFGVSQPLSIVEISLTQ